MIVLKSAREIAYMREAGALVAEAHQLMRSMAVPGARTIDIDEAVADLFEKNKAEPLFKGVRSGKAPPFPAVVCTSVNEQVVHGIPGDYELQEGDILSVDTGCRLDGWCGDAATTLPIGKVSEEAQKLLDVGARTLAIAIEELGRQKKWSQVAQKMEQYVHANGFSLVEDFVGHGIGRQMHEQPQVPNFYSKKSDFWLKEGLVLAIEPMVNVGTKQVKVLNDHWTVVTKDSKLSVHFEHTVALTSAGPEVLSVLRSDA